MDYIKQETGWGIIPKAIMRSKALSIQAKAVYAYLCGFAGNSQRAFPTAELITAELGISKNSFYKYLKELKSAGAISIEKENTEDGTFGRNVYLLNNSIKHTEDELIDDTEKVKNETKKDCVSPCTKNCDTEPCTNLPYMDLPYTVNCDTNINNINKNNIDTCARKNKKEKKDYKKDIKEILELWNEEAEKFGLPKTKLLTNLRKRKLMSLLKANKKSELLDGIAAIKRSKFLQGLDGGWKITFDWLLSDTNRVKVLEGNYDDKVNNAGSHSNKKDAYLMNDKRQTDGMTEKELEQLLSAGGINAY